MKPSGHNRVKRMYCLLVVASVVACSPVFGDSDLLPMEDNMTLTLKSSAFDNGGPVPSRYTCQGDDVSPPLTWTGVPETARSLVLIIEDPDAPDPAAPKMTWVHWLLYNIPPDVPGLPGDIGSTNLPPGTQEGLNSWKKTGYGGPCPPIGRHRYFHKLYALDTVLKGLHTPTRAELLAAIKGHVVAQTELVGTYRK